MRPGWLGEDIRQGGGCASACRSDVVALGVGEGLTLPAPALFEDFWVAAVCDGVAPVGLC